MPLWKSNYVLVRYLCLLLILPLCFSQHLVAKDITYHNGNLLSGNLNLVFIWYGQFGRVQKNILNTFVKSLNYNAAANIQPQVSEWWNIVETFPEVACKGKGPITVKVSGQITDASYSAGKVLTMDLVKPLLQMAIAQNPNSFPVIFTAKDVSVQGLCTGKCSLHGLHEKTPYIIVGNPEKECPGACAWPFHKADTGPIGVTLNPPNGNVGADAMVIAFAQGLVNLVTNPENSGFYEQHNKGNIEAGTACPRIFGTGSMAGYAGKIRINPSTGGSFNAHGSRGKLFLLPAVWNPKTKSCWTLM